MGSAKYAEDDREIFTDRMYLKERKNKGPTIYESEDIDASIEKLENIYEKNKIVNGSEASHSLDDNKKRNTTVLEENSLKTAIKQPKECKEGILCCAVCGKEFEFSKKDEEEYDKNGWRYPNRCPKCERRKYLPTWIKI